MAEYVDPRIIHPTSLRLTGEALETINQEAGGGGEVTSADITDSTEVGRNILTSETGESVRGIIGAVGDSVATTSVNGLMASADKTKLNGIAAGATVNSTDAQLRDRSTHTGTQAISTVVGLQAALDGKVGIDAFNALEARVAALETALPPVED